MANISLIVSKLDYQLTELYDKLIKNYDEFPDQSLYTAMIDLSDSSNYRLSKGPRKGYIRSETFFAAIKSVVGQDANIHVLKELGDASLLLASSIRPLFESLILITSLAERIRSVANDDLYPFSVRCGITYGILKKLGGREREDFLGESLDRLSRLMSVKRSDSNILIEQSAFLHSQTIFEEYKSFSKIGDVQGIPLETSKNMITPIFYRPVIVDRDKLLEFKDHFIPWNKIKPQESGF